MEYYKGSVTYKNTQKLSDKLQESNEMRLDCCCVVYTVHCEALITMYKQPNTHLLQFIPLMPVLLRLMS
jgi:hypothetical protein